MILCREFLADCPCAAIVVDNPYIEFARLSKYFDRSPEYSPGIHPQACVSSKAEVAATAHVGCGAVVEPGAKIGANTVIGAHCNVGENTVIAEDCHIFPQVTLYHGCTVGARTRIHSGSVIGADGFGYARDKLGVSHKIYQQGGVCIGEDVEIGACSSIDRGALEDTLIGRGVKIDNQVQIAHNVRIGDYTTISGCTGIAGSTQIGQYCQIGGMVGIVDHLKIVDHVAIYATAFVGYDILEPGIYAAGSTVVPQNKWRRNNIRFHHLDDMYRRLIRLEKQLSDHGLTEKENT